MRILKIAFLSSASIDVAMVVAIVLIVSLAGGSPSHVGSKVPYKSVHPENLFFILLLVPEFFSPMRGLALAYQDRANATATTDYAMSLEAFKGQGSDKDDETTRDDPGKPAQEAAIIRAENLYFRWDETQPDIIRDVCFSVHKGEVLVIEGPSGAGKSTLLEILLGFVKPHAGRLVFNGQDTFLLKGREHAKHYSWVSQRPLIFAGSIRDNILFARPEAGPQEVLRAVKCSGLEPVLSQLPAGLDTPIGEGGYGLSGGQAQRIAIARAFLKDAPILLLDEPTAHLDPVAEESIMAAIASLSRDRAVVLVSHASRIRSLGTKTLSLAPDNRRPPLSDVGSRT